MTKLSDLQNYRTHQAQFDKDHAMLTAAANGIQAHLVQAEAAFDEFLRSTCQMIQSYEKGRRDHGDMAVLLDREAERLGLDERHAVGDPIGEALARLSPEHFNLWRACRRGPEELGMELASSHQARTEAGE